MPFTEAFNEFRATGIFTLSDSDLISDEPDQIRLYLQQPATETTLKNNLNCYQFHLTNVQLIATSYIAPVQSTSTISTTQEHVERGAVKFSEKPRSKLTQTQADTLNLYRLFTGRENNIPAEAGEQPAYRGQTDSRDLIEGRLLQLLTLSQA